jgi:hypothetical protein
MKKRNTVILCLIGLFIVILLIPFWPPVHYFYFIDENSTLPTGSKAFISLLKSKEDDNFISIDFNINSNNQIENFKYYDGFIQIGNYNLELNKEKISIDIDLNKDFNNVYWVIKGQEPKSKMNEPIITKNEKNNGINIYFFSFTLSSISDNEIKIIIDNFKKKNTKTKLYLKYEIEINNEIVIKEINEEYTLNIITNRTNLLSVIIIYILSGGKG